MSPPLSVFSVDPGCTRAGWARLVLHRTPAGGRFLFERGGHRELDRGWLHAELQQLREQDGILALETLIGGRFFGRATRPLLETRAMEQRILDIAENAGWPMPPAQCLSRAEQVGQRLLKIPAGNYTLNRPKKQRRGALPKPPPKRPRKVKSEVFVEGWRGELLGNVVPSDEQIALVCRAMVDGAAAFVEGLPKLRREHVYDSLGLAVVAAHRFLGIRVVLPQDVAAELWKIQQQEGVQRAAEKAAAKPGVKVPKEQLRLYSRAERREMGDRTRAARAGR